MAGIGTRNRQLQLISVTGAERSEVLAGVLQLTAGQFVSMRCYRKLLVGKRLAITIDCLAISGPIKHCTDTLIPIGIVTRNAHIDVAALIAAALI